MRDVVIGQTDYTVFVKILLTTGAPATGLTEASIDIAYARVETDNDVTTSDVTPAALAALTDAHTDWGFEEVSATDHPGLYRLDIADAVFASGAWEAVVTITDASGTDFYAVDVGFRLITDVADAVWDEAYIGHQTTGSYGAFFLSMSTFITDIGTVVDEITAKLGAFTATGVNTVLGFFRALMRKDGSITTPSDVGGNYTHTTDSTEAIRDTLPDDIAEATIKKNTAFSNFQFVMFDTDGDPATGKTVTATCSIDGAAFAACANSVSEVSSGFYKINLAAADLNGDSIALRFTATGCKDRQFLIVPES